MDMPPRIGSSATVSMSDAGTSSTLPKSNVTVAELDNAIEKYQQALRLSSEDLDDKASQYERLGIAFHSRYQTTCCSDDLQEALENYFQSLEATPRGDPERQRRFQYFESGYGDEFEKSGQLADLDRAIKQCEEALDCVDGEHPDRPRRLHHLAERRRDRFHLVRITDDIDKSIALCQEALELTHESHVDWPIRASNLASTCHDKFQVTKAKTDLDKCLFYYSKAYCATPKNRPEHTYRMKCVGDMHVQRYQLEHDVSDLHTAIQYYESTVAETPPSHPNLDSRIQHLGTAYHKRFQRLGQLGDLESALRCFEETFSLTPTEHPDYGYRMCQLGLEYGERFRREENMQDFETAISLLRQSIDVAPEGHPELVHQIYNLAVVYGDGYDRTSSVDMLDASIKYYNKAIGMRGVDRSERAHQLQSLGCAYHSRYERQGAFADLRVAIQHYVDARDLTAEDSPEWSERLQHVGVGYHASFDRFHEIEDINIAISMYKRALDVTPADHMYLLHRIIALGRGYYERYQTSGDLEDLDAAIHWHQTGLNKNDTLNVRQRTFLLECLGAEHKMKYERLGNLPDLEIAMRISLEALDATPERYSNRARRMHYVATCYHHMYKRAGKRSDLEHALGYLHDALDYTYGSPTDRFPPGKMLFNLYTEDKNWKMAYKVASEVVSLVPLLASASLENTDKQFMLASLAEVAGLACDGAAVAILAGERPYQAIALLEMGRGVLLGALSDMRMDVSDLAKKHPDVADEYMKLRDQLDEPVASHLDTINALDRANKRHSADRQLQSLVTRIRELPGFDRFLLPSLESEILNASSSGTIVVVNVSNLRCDAFIVEESQIRILPLPRLHIEDIRIRSTALDARSINRELLEWLWNVFVGEILHTLGLSDKPLNVWPRIWWIPTGLLTRFPIHAAGYHFRATNETACDRAISSYSSSIRALIRCRQSFSVQNTNAALLIGMENTPKHARLPYAAKEVEMLRELLEAPSITPIDPDQKKNEVLSALRQCNIFHFAGHGSTHGHNPLLSKLMLQDWEDNPLTVGDLLLLNIYESSPLLAYLSACGTGRITKGNFADESVHLINAYQLVGFRHVVGTLWEIRDELCVGVAKIVYETLEDGDMSSEAVCRGLHTATRTFRDHWVATKDDCKDVSDREMKDNSHSTTPNIASASKIDFSMDRSERDVIAMDDENDPEALSLLGWIPYVHYGI